MPSAEVSARLVTQLAVALSSLARVSPRLAASFSGAGVLLHFATMLFSQKSCTVMIVELNISQIGFEEMWDLCMDGVSP